MGYPLFYYLNVAQQSHKSYYLVYTQTKETKIKIAKTASWIG